MSRAPINRHSGRVVTVLAVIALLTVFAGYFQAPANLEKLNKCVDFNPLRGRAGSCP